jgi:hypothetical protein
MQERRARQGEGQRRSAESRRREPFAEAGERESVEKGPRRLGEHREGRPRPDPARELLAHNRLIDDLADLPATVADEYALTNDPDIDVAYLIDTLVDKSPLAIERMGQLRALGTGVLTRKQPLVLSQQVEFTVLLAGLNASVDSACGAISKRPRATTPACRPCSPRRSAT